MYADVTYSAVMAKGLDGGSLGGVGHRECCDCYRSRLRTTRGAVVALGVG